MIKRVKEQGYLFKHPLGDVVDVVEVGVSDTGRRSLSAGEIARLTRKAASDFIGKNYQRSIHEPDFSLSSAVVRAIMVFLNVNQEELGKLIGCQKSKISKILRDEQQISKSQAMLALERLAQEIVRPGAIRAMLGDEGVTAAAPNSERAKEINDARYPKRAA